METLQFLYTLVELIVSTSKETLQKTWTYHNILKYIVNFFSLISSISFAKKIYVFLSFYFIFYFLFFILLSFLSTYNIELQSIVLNIL